MPEVTNVTVTEQTLFNLTITEDSGTSVTVSLTDPVTQVFTSLAEIDAAMVNNGTGLGVYKQKDTATFIMRSITDDDKTIDTSLQNSDNEIRIKLPDSGISTPDNFTINADSDSSANIKLVGPTVDLSKAKLLTELDANGQEINNILNATATDSFIGDLRGAVKFRAKAGEDLSKGEAVYISGISGNTPVVSLAKADSATTMPAYGLVFADANENANVEIIEFGDLKGLDTETDSLELDKPVYVSATTAGGITATRPTGATHLVQNIGLVNRVHQSAGAIKVGGSGRVNDVPNTFSITGDITTTAGTITAPTGAITTVNATTINTSDLNVSDDLVVTDDLTVSGSVQIAENIDVFTNATFRGNINQYAGDTATFPVLNSTTANLSTANITTGTVTTGNITTVNATDVNVSDDLVVTDDASVGGDLAVTGNTVLTGNLTVNGTQTIVNTETLTVDDNIIVLNNNEAGTPSQNGGIEIERGTSVNATLLWNETTDKFEFKEGSGFTDIKALDAEFTNDLTIGNDATVGGDLTVTGTTTFDVIGNTSRIIIDCNDLNTTSGDGIVLYDSDRTDNNLTNSNSAEALHKNGGTAPYNTGGDSPVTYITNESIEMHLDAVRAGNHGTTILKPDYFKLVKDGAGTDTITTITSDSASFANTLNTVGTATLGNLSVTGEVTSHLIPDTNTTYDLGSPSKEWRSVYVGAGSLYIDGHKVLGSDATDQIDFTTDTDQNLNITAGGSGTAGAITMSSAGNLTTINDTTINLGSALNDATVNARGDLNVAGNMDIDTADIGNLTISQSKISNTASNIELETNASTGYAHLNAPNVFVGPFGGALQLNGSSIGVTTTDGNLQINSNGAGLIKLDDLEFSNADSAWGESKVQFTAPENHVMCLKSSGDYGYNFFLGPSTFIGDAAGLSIVPASSAATVLKPYGGQNLEIKPNGSMTVSLEGNVTGDLTGNLTADATTEKLTTKNIISNADSVTIPGVAQWGGFNMFENTGGVSSATKDSAQTGGGYPFIGVTQTSNTNDSQPQAQYLINHMNYDISGGTAGHGVSMNFAAQDETGKLIDIAKNLCKIQSSTVGGSSGSSTVNTWEGEYTLSVTGNNGSSTTTTNAITTNKDFTQLTQELRICDVPGNSGSTSLSGLYLTYDGAQTGTPTAKIQLRDNDGSSTTNLMTLEEDRVSHKVIQKQHQASSDPSGENGDMYYNTTTHKFRGYANGAWTDLH